MKESNAGRSLAFIQSLRGFALLCVVGVHTLSFFTSLKPAHPLLPFLTFGSVLFVLAVPLFIWISGFVLAFNYPHATSWTKYYKKRISSVLPAYLVSSLAYLVFSSFSIDQWSWQFPGFRIILFKIMTGSSYGHLWFVFLIFQFYLIFPFFSRYCLQEKVLRNPWKWFILFIIIQTLWHINVPTFLSDNLLGFSGYSSLILLASRSFFSYIFFFVLGVYMGVKYYKDRQLGFLEKLPLWPFAVFAAFSLLFVSQSWVVGIGIYGSFNNITETFRLGEKIFFPLLYGSLIIICLKISLIFSSRANLLFYVLTILGNRSFGIYLIHAGILIICYHLLILTGVVPSSVLFYILLFIAVLSLSFIFEGLLARAPFFNFIIGRKAE